MEATLDEYQVRLLRRLYDACLLNQSVAPDFRELMSDQASKLGAHWYHETYEDFMALGLLDPKASGEAFGPTPFGRLSAHGRWFVESMGEAESSGEPIGHRSRRSSGSAALPRFSRLSVSLSTMLWTKSVRTSIPTTRQARRSNPRAPPSA
jgi:hypothetical protein